MELVNKEEGGRGVAVLVNAFGANYIDMAVNGVKAAGRAIPLVYRKWNSSQEATSDGDVEDWLEGRRDRPDLVADVNVSRGWEERTIVVLEIDSVSYGVENLYLRTISR